jgi:hypothetical protein
VSFFRKGFSAIGKLFTLGVLVIVFFAGMIGVVLMSLQGTEIKVPEITGKNFSESERELASLGLKIKKRADRVSQEPPNTIIEQLPRPGETVKTGQMILVVTSKAPSEGEEAPRVLKKTDDDDASKIEEMISDKPKKPKANTNSNRKKADTTRDVAGDNSNSNAGSNSNSADGNSNTKEHGTDVKPPTNKNTSTGTRPSGSNTSRPPDSRPHVSNRP